MGSITRSFANNLNSKSFDGTKLTGDIPDVAEF